MAKQFIEIQIKHPKKGLKQFIRKLMMLNMYNVTVGIHKNEGRRRANTRTNSKSNIAKVASILEAGADYIQSKTIVIKGDNLEKYIIPEGTHIHIPSRLFLSIHKISEAFNSLKTFCNGIVQEFVLRNRSVGSAKTFWEQLGREAQRQQKLQITGSYTERNSTLTELIKGFNHPLFDTGKLLESIKYKVNKTWTTGAKKLARLQYLSQADEMWEKLK